ncbi:ABC transporter substrate-binding protein [Candidatus Phytoplasma ziziphi]|nr:ABC transporter substrate-binding protein [Candidatus Phytoplasma ziziphi]
MIKKEKIKNFLTNKNFIISFICLLIIILVLGVYFFQKEKFDIVFAFHSDISGFDTCDKKSTTTSYGDIYFNLVHDKLLILDEQGNLKPQLLKNYDKQGVNINCELKDNILFHNGDKMTADDVVFTIQRGKTQKHDQFLEIADIQKTGNLTFKIKLKEDILWWHFPFTQMIRIINKKATEKNQSEGVKIGAGPYKLKKYNPNKDLQLELFEKYHDKDIIKDSPKKIQIKISKDENTLFQELEKKQINAILFYSRDKINKLNEDLKKDKYKNIKILENETASQNYIYFNKQKLTKKVRQIISKSLDIQKIIDELKLPGKIAKNSLHNKLIGHNPNINYHNPNIEEAKREFRTLTESENKTLKIATSLKTPFINKIIEQLEHVGFTIILEEPDFNTIIANAAQGKNSPYDFIFLSENFEMNFGHKFIEDYFMSNNNECNFCGIDNADKSSIQDKLEKAKKKTEETEYKSLLFEIEQYLYDNHYLFPLMTGKSFILVNKEIEKGFEQNAFSRFFNMRSIKIKKDK